jgi:hypothetical protein
MDPLHATIEEFAADGYTHIECVVRDVRVMRLRPISWLSRISMGLHHRSATGRCASRAELKSVFSVSLQR